MKKLTVSIVTLFFVLFSSVFVANTASAEETLNIPIGQAKTNKNVYGPEIEKTELVEEKIPPNREYQALPVQGEDAINISKAGVNPIHMYQTYTDDNKVRFVYKEDINFKPSSNDPEKGTFILEREVLVYDVKTTKGEIVEETFEPNLDYQAYPVKEDDADKVSKAGFNPTDMYRTYTRDGHLPRYVYKKDVEFIPTSHDPTEGTFTPKEPITVYNIEPTTTEKTELVEEKLTVKKYQAVALDSQDIEKINKAGVNPDDMYRTSTEDGKTRFVYKKDITFIPSENDSTQGYFVPNTEISVYDIKTTTTKPLLVAEGTVMDAYEYKNGQFSATLQTTKEQIWLNEADVSFDLITKDKETPVGATIGTIVALDANRTTYANSNGTSPNGTLTFDSFKTKLDVKGKTSAFYNVGVNKWINGNTDEVRFFPVGAKTNLYKLVYDARDLEGSLFLKDGITEAGFDNTGFIYRVFKDQGYRVGKFTPQTFEKIAAKVTKPQIGDLIFIKDDSNETKTVGIIIDKDGKYIAATEKDGVKVYDFKTTDTNISGFGRLR